MPVHTEYGLAAYIWGSDMTRVRKVVSQLRASRVCINGASGDLLAPFGGYKKSGNGREWGEYGFNEFLEVKAVLGYAQARNNRPHLLHNPTKSPCKSSFSQYCGETLPSFPWAAAA
jgi:hypothetical protein